MENKNPLALLPSANDILQSPGIKELSEQISPKFVLSRVQKHIQIIRENLQNQKIVKQTTREHLAELIIKRSVQEIRDFLQPNLRKVINATGIILHTGLGRAPLSDSARENLLQVIDGYCNLELYLNSGKRGKREKHVEELLCFLTGAEAACVVNNNAAAVFLALNTLSFGKEAIVSRGQLIEIGGSFRIPEVMEKSGVNMVEVGTTNKTHLHDYEKAITPNTGVICVVHPSNFRVKGFTAEAQRSALIDLAHENQIPVLHDLGGGVLVDLRDFNLPYEPVVSEAVANGADVVTFSGDKVLGGPQCGIIVGKKTAIEKIKTNPLMRVLRCDKLTYSLLEPTLKLYLQNDFLLEKNLVLKMLLEPVEKLKERVQRFIGNLPKSVKTKCEIQAEKSVVQIGSGALPLEELPSWAVSLNPHAISCEQLARKFRKAEMPVLGYIRDEKLYLDFRTVFEKDEPVLKSIFEKIL